MMKNVIKKVLCTLFSLALSANVSAHDFEVDGICYDVVSLTDLTCIVVKKYNHYRYDEYSGDIVIPSTVDYANKTLTVIGIENKTFKDASNLTGITIPNTISYIGDNMFSFCFKLERVTIEDGETTLYLGKIINGGSEGMFANSHIKTLYIGRNLSYDTSYNQYLPFYENKYIEELTIGDFVTTIGEYEFYGCSSLSNLTIGNSVKTIEEGAFEDCKSLKSLTIPNSVTTIKLGAFFNCEIEDLTIGDSLESVGSSAFSGIHGGYRLTSLHISNLATWCKISLGGIPFNSVAHFYLNDEEIKDLVISDSITRIRADVFANFKGLTSVTIGNSVESVGSSAFKNCTGLTNVEIGNSVTTIENYAFSRCSSLTNVTISNSVISIGRDAFSSCSKLTNVTLGSSLTEIGDDVFSGCGSLTTLYSLNTTPPNVGTGNFSNNRYMTLNVYVPQEALDTYQEAEPWKNFWNLQGFDPTGINNMKVEGRNANAYYDLRGNRLDAPNHGLNIIKMSDGTTKKVMVK